MKNPVVHLELSAKDHAAAAQWYQKIFDWEIQHMPEMNYSTASYGDPNAGVGFSPIGENVPAGTVVSYIQVDDIHAALEAVNGNGGQTVMPAMPVDTVGQIAWFRDPSGNVVGLLQPEAGEGN